MNRIRKIASWRSLAVALLVIFTLPTFTALAGVDDDISNYVGRQNRWYFDNQRFHFYPFSAPRALKIQMDDIIVPTLHTTWTTFSIPGMGYSDMCESRGFALPYGAQITSSKYAKDMEETSESLPQPDPDGLYKETVTTDQTLVVCLRNGQYVAEVHEELTTVYMTPVHLEYLPDGVHQKLVHDTNIPAVVTVDVDGINAQSAAAGQPSNDFPED